MTNDIVHTILILSCLTHASVEANKCYGGKSLLARTIAQKKLRPNIFFVCHLQPSQSLIDIVKLYPSTDK